MLPQVVMLRCIDLCAEGKIQNFLCQSCREAAAARASVVRRSSMQDGPANQQQQHRQQQDANGALQQGVQQQSAQQRRQQGQPGSNEGSAGQRRGRGRPRKDDSSSSNDQPQQQALPQGGTQSCCDGSLSMLGHRLLSRHWLGLAGYTCVQAIFYGHHSSTYVHQLASAFVLRCQDSAVGNTAYPLLQ